MGNVLSLEVDVLPSMAASLGMTVHQIVSFAGDDFHGLLVGAKTAAEFWQAFNRHFGTDVRQDPLITYFHPVIDLRMEQLILDLKAAGQRVVCGTNTIETHYRYHLEHGEYTVFDRVYASNLLGIAKPSPAFFEYILEQEGWQGYNTFFIDDLAANVDAAGSLGIRSFFYESPRSFPALLDRLAEWKVLPAPWVVC
jgi:FMN phosphatase YigB (HAD superfamily)